METQSDEGDTTAFVFYRPLLLCLVLMACAKTTRQSEKKPIPITQPTAHHEEPTAPPRKKKKKKIFLTFDDGPNRGTRKVLSIVKEEQVPVTFFLIGEHVFASTTQRATWDSLRVAESIELCNHSHTHAWNNRYNKFYQHPDSVVSDFRRCRDSLGLANNITRTPGRNIWRVDTLRYTDLSKSAVAADSLQQAGFSIIGWDLEWHYDHKSFTLRSKSDELMGQIDSLFAINRTRVPEHLVLLAHDQVYDDANDSAELHQLIKKLKARDDYELLVTSKFPGVKPGRRDSSVTGVQ